MQFCQMGKESLKESLVFFKLTKEAFFRLYKIVLRGI